MAVTVEGGSHVTGNAACPCPATLTLTGFSPTGCCRFAVIAVGLQPGCITVSSMTRTGDTGANAPTFIQRQNCPPCTNVELWKILQPGTGANDIVINFSCSPAGVGASGINFNGVCQTTPNDTPLNVGGCATSSSLSPTTTADEYVTDVINVICPACPPTITSGANQTRRLNHNDNCGISNGSSDEDGGSGGAMTWSWVCTGARNHLAMNINNAAGCAPVRSTFEFVVNPGAII